MDFWGTTIAKLTSVNKSLEASQERDQLQSSVTDFKAINDATCAMIDADTHSHYFFKLENHGHPIEYRLITTCFNNVPRSWTKLFSYTNPSLNPFRLYD